MIKPIFLTLFVILTFNLSNAQIDSIKYQIQQYDNTKSDLISKGRKLLLDNFIKGNLTKVKEVMTYFKLEIDDNDYMSLYLAEKLLLYYWTNEYNLLLSDILIFNSSYLEIYIPKFKPNFDMLFNKIQTKSFVNYIELEQQLLSSSITNEQKDFLKLFLQSLLLNKEQTFINQEIINIKSSDFLIKYPHSKYEYTVRQNIRHVYITSDWGWVAEFFSGYGWYTDDLTDKFTNCIPIGIAFDVYYKDIALYLRNFIGFSSTKMAIQSKNNVIWENNAQVRVFLPELSLGYLIMDNNFLKIAPFLGISSTAFSPTQNDEDHKPGYKDVGLDFTMTYTIGLNMDIKLGRSTIPMVSVGPEESYWFLRMRFNYSAPQFNKKYTGFNGHMFYLTIGVGGFGRKIIRDL